MPLPDELAALHERVGTASFLDPASFRAAFDDFVDEGSATTGELSLLVDAIASGALQRLLDQLAVAADPATAIAAQGDLLARDRGTSETGGTRWALSALAFAMGAITRDSVLTTPMAPTSAPSPAVVPAVAPAVVSVETQTVAPPVPSVEPAHRSRRVPLLLGGAVLLVLVAIAVAFALTAGDDDDPATPSRADGAGGEVLASDDFKLDGQSARLELTHDGEKATVVLSVADGSDYRQVASAPVGCAYTDGSQQPRIEAQVADRQVFVTWRWADALEGYGEYGELDLADESLRMYGGENCLADK